MFRIAFTLASVWCASRLAAQQTTGERSSARGPFNAITIHQEVDFQVGPQRLYEALLDSKQFSAFSGRPAQIDPAVGGAFSLFGGHIVGRNVELVPNQRIVQVWRVVDWPEGAYSIVKFELKVQGASTHLVFDHTGFPEGLHDHLAAGWEANYWALLKKYLQQ
jgi:activator of HSP90 ATPase